MKNLLITGDSYCFDAHEELWTGKIAKLLNMNLICRGFPGNHWWPSRQFVLNQNLSDVGLAIFCHTDCERPIIPIDRKHIFHSLSSSEQQDLLKNQRIFLNSPSFYEWCQINWFAEIENLFPQTPLVHLFCFDHSLMLKDHIPKGLIFENSLTEISLNEFEHPDLDKLFLDQRPNHLSQINHCILSDQLFENIVSYMPQFSTKIVTKFDVSKFHRHFLK